MPRNKPNGPGTNPGPGWWAACMARSHWGQVLHRRGQTSERLGCFLPGLGYLKAMHLFYYDEVKFDPPIQLSFWLGGVCVEANSVPAIEEAMNEISNDVFGSRLLVRETEFHGQEICGGRGNFKGRPLDERISILARVLAIIAREDVKRIYVRIIPANITHSPRPPDEIAFMYLIEQFDRFLGSEGSLGLMFGDYDEPTIGSSVASLSQFRSGGTNWDRGREIGNIIDTVHFARSHHSRMIQLADIYLYSLQFILGDNAKPWRTEIASTIRASGVLSATRARVWPSYAQWYR